MADLPLLVSLTTLPSRVGHLRPTLDSLADQTRPADRILLCLPRVSRREGVAYPRPDWLADYAPLVQVVACAEDDGPGTKLLGALPQVTAPACLVIADDDMRYGPTFLDNLYQAQCADRRAAFSYYTYHTGPITVGQGADGFCFYTPYLLDLPAFAQRAMRSPHLRVVDDLWISAFLWRQGIPIRSLAHLIPDGVPIYQPSHTESQLRNLSGELARRTAMQRGLAFMQETGMLGRGEQLKAWLKKPLRRLRS
jgi:hypothetical protein